MTIKQTIERLQRIQIEPALAEAINRTKADYIALNESQLAAGITRDTANIEPYPYSAAYAKKRQKAGLQTDHIDLNFTGTYYKEFTAKISGTKLELGSEVSYEPFISKRYNPLEIYGLTEENMDKYRAIVRPIVQGLVKAQFYG